MRPVAACGATVIVNLDRVGGGDCAGVCHGQTRPFGMRDRHEGPGTPRPLRQFGPAFLVLYGYETGRVRWCEICGQTHGQDVPKFAVFHCAGMKFGPEDGCEILCTKRGCVCNWISVLANEVIGQRNEIITLIAVATADLFRFQAPV